VAPIGAGAVEVELRLGGERLFARISRRSQQALGLAPGRPVFAVIKAIVIDRRNLGRDARANIDFPADFAEAEMFDG
jgi:molybdate transport system ATP-binding protein